MKRYPSHGTYRRPSRIAMFLEWLFLIGVVSISAILLSRLWLRATEQEPQPTPLSVLSTLNRTPTPPLFSVAESSATTAARLQNPDIVIQTTSLAVVEEISVTNVPSLTPVSIADTEMQSSDGGLVGQPAPDFTLPTLNGDEISLSNFRGQPVLINFWASWCEPCRIEMPMLINAYQRYSADGLVILGLNVTEQDTIEFVNSFVNEFVVPYPILLDQGEEVSHEDYRLIGLPMSVFIDRAGIVKRVVIGALRDDEIDLFIGEILR